MWCMCVRRRRNVCSISDCPDHHWKKNDLWTISVCWYRYGLVFFSRDMLLDLERVYPVTSNFYFDLAINLCNWHLLTTAHLYLNSMFFHTLLLRALWLQFISTVLIILHALKIILNYFHCFTLEKLFTQRPQLDISPCILIQIRPRLSVKISTADG